VAISLVEYEKALNSLREALKFADLHQSNELQFKIARDACIQRFEFCIELAWKSAAKILGSSSSTAKPVIREMAQNSLIDDTEIWFGFIEARNRTSHSYDEAIASQVFAVTRVFLPEGDRLLSKLKIK